MASKCWSNVRGKVARVTRLDECCEPVSGPCSTITTSGFVSVNYTAEIEEGEEYLLKNANGEVCVVDRGCPELKYYNLEIEFCQVDPELFEMTTGQELVYDWQGIAVGNDIGEKVQCESAFSLEVWTNIPGQECTPGVNSKAYGYFLLPCVSNGILGDFTIENDAVTFTISAQSRAGNKWNRGPYDVEVQDANGTPGPLVTPIESGKHLRLMRTEVPPPDPTCGCRGLQICDPDCDSILTVVPPTEAGEDVVYTFELVNDGECPLTIVSAEFCDSQNTTYNLLSGEANGATVDSNCPDTLSNVTIQPGGTITCEFTLVGYEVPPGTEVSGYVLSEVSSDSGGSDGCRTPDADYTVPDLPPVLTILEPAGGNFPEGECIQFDATVEDDEIYEDLADQIIWSSDLDGQFATGDEPIYCGLSVGTHTITAEVTDSGGNTVTQTVSVTIDPAP